MSEPTEEQINQEVARVRALMQAIRRTVVEHVAECPDGIHLATLMHALGATADSILLEVDDEEERANLRMTFVNAAWPMLGGDAE